VAYQPFSAIGTLTLDGAGNFTITQSTFVNGAVQKVTGSGTYTVNGNCTVSLKFTPNTSSGGGNTGSLALPAGFTGLLTSGSTSPSGSAPVVGLLSIKAASGDYVTGLVIPQ